MYQIIEKNKVEINGKQLIFPFTINDSLEKKIPYILEFNNFIIVNFFPSGPEELSVAKKNMDLYYTNVWAFNQNGDLVWKIERLDWLPNKTGAYSAIYIKDGELLASNTLGTTVSVNPENGKVTRLPNQGRPW